jgi:ectoine hydroxylase-related dioxygenase (phytanoyl-CoA dioxygenase family)
MTKEELYLFDTLGFLRVKNVLDPDTVAQAYESGQRIVRDYERLLDGPKGKSYGDKYRNAFLHDKVLERISYSPQLMDYICHVTNNQPRLTDGTMMVQNADHGFHNFHLRKDIDTEIREDAPRFYTDMVNRQIYMDYVTFFVYLTDVREGDGGLLVVPGSHRASFKYPPEMFYEKDAYPVDPESRQKLGFINVTVNAGDMIIMPLRLNHAALPWLPRDRDRIVMFYTYRPQFYFAPEAERMLERVHTEGIELDEATRDLISMRGKAELKEVVKNHLAEGEGS